jgi:hypothetical protein
LISLRYHLVTIAAIFLALAVGLLGGGAFVQPALQQQLEESTQRLQRDNARLREQIDEVRAEVGAFARFADAAMPHLTADRLLGRTAVIVVQDGVEDAVIDQAQAALTDGGAEVVAVLSTLPSLASEEPDVRRQLADIVGIPGASDEQVVVETASALAGRLADGNDGSAPEDDVLNRLLSAGFLDTNTSEDELDRIGLSSQVFVVLAGGPTEEPILMPEDFAVPLVASLEDLGVPVAAGESTSTAVPFVAGVNGTSDGGVVTVDDLDLSMGGAALVLGLDRLVTSGIGGSYGFKDGADLLPPP